MNEIRTRILVDQDHRISGTAPAEVPPGEHDAVIMVVVRPPRPHAMQPFSIKDLPTHDHGHRPDGLMCGDLRR